jgi:5-formyltetrahydrofolate cyclo-ligase
VQFKSKRDLRERILTLLRNQKEEERLKKSAVIFKKLFKLKAFKQAKTVLFYASFDGEVHTFDMMKKAQQLGKRIGLPKTSVSRRRLVPILIDNIEKDLKSGHCGILEPKKSRGKILDIKEIDMIIVPGVAFDKRKNRLGRGEGYYDRFLETLPPFVSTVALAFDFQMIDHLPHQEQHDICVSYVLSN